MSDYLFDLGNSRLKWAPADSPAEIQAHPHNGTHIALPPEVAGDVVWLASVAPDALRTELLSQLTARFNRVHCAAPQTYFGGLTLGYAEPRQLGVDRFLSLLACVPVLVPTLVVSVGTALTIDAILPSGRHLGGLIAPAPDLMRASLQQVSNRLTATGGEVTDFAGNTLDGTASGCEWAAVALIENRWQALAQQSGAQVQCLLHGGGAKALARHLPEARLSSNLVLQGLAVWRNAASAPRMTP